MTHTLLPAELPSSAASTENAISQAWKTVIGAASALALLHIEDKDEHEAMMAQVRLIASALPSNTTSDLYKAAAQGHRSLVLEDALNFMLAHQNGMARARTEIQAAFEAQTDIVDPEEFARSYCLQKMQSAVDFKPTAPQPATAVIHWSPSSGQWHIDMLCEPMLKKGERLPLYSRPTLLVLDERTKFDAWYLSNKFGGMRESMWAAWEARALLLLPMLDEEDELERFYAWFNANKFGGMRESMKAAWLGRAELAEPDVETVLKPEQVVELLEGTLLSAGGAEALRKGESVEMNLEELVLTVNLAIQVSRKLG